MTALIDRWLRQDLCQTPGFFWLGHVISPNTPPYLSGPHPHQRSTDQQ